MSTISPRILAILTLPYVSVGAQEIAKDLSLSGWVDSSFTATTSDADGAASTTDFAASSLLRVGWQAHERISATIAISSNPDNDDVFELSEAYGTVTANEQWSFSSGKSYGPFGYYAAEPTGLNTIQTALSVELYTINPTGVWATWTPTAEWTIMPVVAQQFTEPDRNRAASVSPGLDVAFAPNETWVFNGEVFIDPSAGALAAANDSRGDLWYASFNLQFSQEPWTAAAEIIYQLVENAGADNTEDQGNLTWAAFVTYQLPETPFPMSVSAQVSQLVLAETRDDLSVLTANTVAKSTATLGQLALLTNPLESTAFGLNFEAFIRTDDAGGTAEKVTAFGGAIEGLYVLE
jgi:hypothetical protein